MLGNNALLEMLLVSQVLGNKQTNITDQIDGIIKWAEDFKKKEKEKADKAKSTTDKKIFSAKDMAFMLAGMGIPGGLLMLQGYAYLWNMTYTAVHMMQ